MSFDKEVKSFISDALYYYEAIIDSVPLSVEQELKKEIALLKTLNKRKLNIALKKEIKDQMGIITQKIKIAIELTK